MRPLLPRTSFASVLSVIGAVALAALLAGCGAAQSAPEFPAGCARLVLDTAAGTLNGLAPTASMEQIEAQLPCSTDRTAEGSPFNRGGGVFFPFRDLYFYTHADFIEVRARFDGEIEPPLRALDRPAVEALLGPPGFERSDGVALSWARPWGCLVLLFEGRRVAVVRLHACGCEDVPIVF